VIGEYTSTDMHIQTPFKWFAFYVLLTGSLVYFTDIEESFFGTLLFFPIRLPLSIANTLVSYLHITAYGAQLDSWNFGFHLRTHSGNITNSLLFSFFWGGCILFPFHMYRSTGHWFYKITLRVFLAYAGLSVLAFIGLFLFILIAWNGP